MFLAGKKIRIVSVCSFEEIFLRRSDLSELR